MEEYTNINLITKYRTLKYGESIKITYLLPDNIDTPNIQIYEVSYDTILDTNIEMYSLSNEYLIVFLNKNTVEITKVTPEESTIRINIFY
jgi:hypothetical protein